MKQLFKKIISQKNINLFYHLPKAFLAQVLYGYPTKNLKVIGVTGTDGKTTTTNMIYQVLKDAGKKVSMISSINAVVGGKSYDTGFHVTSPDPFMVQKFARQALDYGDEFLVLEVTSHGLDQFRFWGIKFEVGVITNITHEHLDYHKTFENYSQTKLSLLKNAKHTVFNEDLKRLLRNASNDDNKKMITFGLNKGDFNQKEVKLNLSVPGEYNIENALAAFASAYVLNIDKKIARKTLENFKGVTGRMDEVKNAEQGSRLRAKGVKIIIDFAHTPNALEQALKTLRFQTKGTLIAVFGCAGKRDIEKRSLMGKIAGKLADITIITAEDPRGKLDEINSQITKGLIESGAKENRNFFLINDREQAINFAINKLAKKGDCVGVFGKGHETSMNLDGKKELPWSDFDTVKKALYGQ